MSHIRIIGGEFRSRKIVSVPGMSVRPTSDRLRETIFNILSQKVKGAVVLDMFAGTGAMGIEALSRGAESAVFIDKSHEAISVINRNIALLGLESRTRVIQWDIMRNLNCLNNNRKFTLVFMDPPYDKNRVGKGLSHLYASQQLDPSVCITVEHSVTENISLVSDELKIEDTGQVGFRLFDQRKYGKTNVSFIYMTD